MSEEKECQSCKQKGPGKGQIGFIVLGFYMIFAALYGTIEIVKNLIHLFVK